jgi:putative phosphoribosyl transferase
MARSAAQLNHLLVQVPIGDVVLEGDLVVPPDARRIVAFAHGSGSGRFSPRNQYVAEVLQGQGLATLLLDLLTRAEEIADLQTSAYRFDIEMLADRVAGTVDWLADNPVTGNLRIGLFGASTGAAAALVAAARRPNLVHAVVSRGGRPDMAGDDLAAVRAPTLLIVGGNDPEVLRLNREAYEQIKAEKELVVVPGATHLFEEPGALEEVARLAAAWFVTWL